MVDSKTKTRLQNILYFCMAVSPILSLYSRNGVSLAIVLILVSYLLYFIFVDRSFFICNIFGAALVCFAIFIGVFFALIQPQLPNNSILLRTLQFIVLLFVPLSINPKNSNYCTAKKIYIWVALFASVFLIIQFLILNVFGIYISGLINNPIFPPNESILAITSNTISSGRRVSGIFSEPAAHSVYVLGAFVLTLYEKKIKKQKTILFVMALSILMSVSSTGILGLAFSILLYIISRIIAQKGRIKASSLVVVLIIILSFLVISQTSIWTLFIQRMDQGTSLNTRFSAYGQQFKIEINEVLFGHGMDLESLPISVYYAGFPRFIYYFGFIGLFLWLMMIISSFRGAKPEIILLLLVFVFLNIGESTMLGFSGSLFLLLICLGRIDIKDNLAVGLLRGKTQQ